MSKANANALYDLIKSLSKAEKRHFRLYAKRNFSEKDVKFLVLFDHLDKSHKYNSDKIRILFPKTSQSALSNLKAHLYEQLLNSLRLLHRNDVSVKVYELLSFANVLYSKGLYFQSLEQLRKARQFSEDIEDDLAIHAVIEMERRIELFYVTDSGEDRAKSIVDTNELIRKQLEIRDHWSNVALLLYDYYLKYGHVKNERQFTKVEEFFISRTNDLDDTNISLQGMVYKQMAFTWYYFITQNFVKCYRHASDWLSLLRSNELLMNKEPILYLKGMHNAMSALFYSNKPRQFESVYKDFQEFISQRKSKFDYNTTLLSDIYNYVGELNYRFLNGKFRGNDEFVAELTQWLSCNESFLDQNREQVFQYKIACLYFGADDFKKCIFHLNRIIHSEVKEKYLKQDVQCFARILNLVAHYEIGNDDLVEYQLKSTYRFLMKYGDLQEVQRLIIDFIRKSINMNRNEMSDPFTELRDSLQVIFNNPYEQRPLLYLDLISWLTSRIEGVPVEEVIRKRQLKR
ncbi:MAG: hypothetical protein MK105_15290 [Crocinitomicaceae bacterium]|nr:hypothetical protein [Crocinitomicaceae bacterium]